MKKVKRELKFSEFVQLDSLDHDNDTDDIAPDIEN